MAPSGTSILEANRLSARVSGFIEHLRMNDFKLGPLETRQAVQLIAAAPLTDLADARLRLKILLSSRQEEWVGFDDLFEAYWISRGRVRQRAQSEKPGHSPVPVPGHGLWEAHQGSRENRETPQEAWIGGSGDQDVSGNATGRLIASERGTRMKTDLRQFVDPKSIAEAERLAYALATSLRYRLSRRFRPTTRDARLDLRRTIRASLGEGGEPMRLFGKRRPDRPARIVVLLDVSGSMKSYSRFFLQFVKGLACQWMQCDAYLFHTRLIRVTDALREKDSMKAMATLSLLADGFGGGTKLGLSLARFNDSYAKRSLNSRSVVIIMSDGYDTGPVAALTRELARLKRRARRLVWLNPLLGWRDYEPVTAAMAAAGPFIDHFAAANTLDSLAAIEPDLARL